MEGRKRWRARPPAGQGECDYDPTVEPAFKGESPRDIRANAAMHQATEAVILAKDYSLFRAPKTGPHAIRRDEFSPKRLREAEAAAAGWSRVVREIKKRRRDAGEAGAI
jgi:hypothetical protein